jgi:hypothetical protein
VHAYLIVGHPNSEEQSIEESMHLAQALGIRIMLSEFSPIPGTPDGEQCRRWIDLDEPLWHNKTAFTIHRLGGAEVERLKRLAIELNARLVHPGNFRGGAEHYSPKDEASPAYKAV